MGCQKERRDETEAKTGLQSKSKNLFPLSATSETPSAPQNQSYSPINIEVRPLVLFSKEGYPCEPKLQ